MIQNPDIPVDEKVRLQELRSYDILDSLAEDEFDNLTRIAAQICGTPISLVSLVDESRQWFKSRYNLEATQTSRAHSFCAHAINLPDVPMVVEDARRDPRFCNNPLVLDDPNVIFYAGVPLVNRDGHALGTLCVIDSEPKQLDSRQLSALIALAGRSCA